MPLERVPSVDLSMTNELLKAAIQLIVPEDQTQRKAFEQLMPHLYVLRHRGCSWAQLASLLADGGFKLQPSTVRNYFGEMVQTHMEACRESMTEQLLVLAEIRKETAGADMSLHKERVSAVMENQRAAAAAKIDARFGIGAAAPPAAARHEPASPAREKQQQQPQPQSRQQPQPPQRDAQADETDDDDQFGLLSPSNAPSPTANSPTFFSIDDDAPIIPDLSPRNSPIEKNVAAASPRHEQQAQHARFRCLLVPPGVKPLSKRTGISEAVYKIGDMEHPAVPGVVLSMEQRLSSLALEFVNEDGEIRLETAEEKRFRVKWEKPVPVTHTMTAKNFTAMNMDHFRKTEG